MNQYFQFTLVHKLIILFLIFLLGIYFICMPEAGYLPLQNSRTASWLLGFIFCLCTFLIYVCQIAWHSRKSYLHIIDNMNKLVKSKITAIQANEAKTNFLATISHEIRNPIQAILGIHEFLLNDGSMRGENKKLLISAHHTAKSLLEILNQVLDLTKLESGKYQPSYLPTSLIDLLENTMQSYSALANDHKTQLHLIVDPTIAPSLLIDRVRIRQVLQNLIGNAVKFTKEGSISVTCQVLCDTHAEQLIEFHIADTGCGMNHQDLARIMEPYEQANAQLGSAISGSGLGLSITNNLLQMMGSHLTLVSEEDLGTSASFKISCKRSSAQVQPLNNEHLVLTKNEHAPVKTSTILIVDDYEVCREVLAKQLIQLGYKVRQAANGEEALRVLSEFAIDLVLTDESMPQMLGSELATFINVHYKNIPVIVLTGQIQSLSTSMPCVSQFVIKPVELTHLKEIISHSLGLSAPKSWNLKSLFEFTGSDINNQIDILESLMKCQNQIIIELSQLSADSNPQLIRQLVHKIIGGAKIIQAVDVIKACKQIDDSSFCTFENAKIALIGALQNNNEDINNFLNTLHLNNGVVANQEKIH
ncbi:His Kinase A (phospho-acceptor) domain-containing protein [Polynucleobacter kasalickyi]|uniref:histidine kinase n=2 Tax=Polynucleobacter kasalickyi TaxID=1938817 RepID=A0A1W1YJH6_9BURK|nr:His Kinase A (phospho-acceptor) domain-containing protein [Polynucleobacter kasalickyi]